MENSIVWFREILVLNLSKQINEHEKDLLVFLCFLRDISIRKIMYNPIKSKNKGIKMNFKEAKEFYYNYLTTLAKQWNGEMGYPVRESISKGFKKEDDKVGIDLGAIIHQHLTDGKEVYFWSDHHFYHKNVIEYSNRPFESVAEMNQAMIDGNNQTVNDDSLVIYGGDIAFGRTEVVTEVVERMRGRKLFIYGNHDFNHGKRYNTSCFEESAICAVFPYEINGKTYDVLVSHYPVMSELPENMLNIYGHTHTYLMEGNRFNMCVEHTNYKPKAFSDMLKEIEKKLSSS